MPLLLFHLSNGGIYEAWADKGQSLLQAAQAGGVDGFLAECGGEGRCGTCHCHLGERAAAAVPPPGPEEAQMLDFVATERLPNSRLACQVRVPAGQDTAEPWVIEVPPRQV